MIVELIKIQGQHLEELTLEVAAKLGIEIKSIESGELIDSIKGELDKAPTISDELRMKALPVASLGMIYGCVSLCKKADELNATGEVGRETWTALQDFICRGFYGLGLITGSNDFGTDASLRELFSDLGKLGGAARHMPNKQLREWTLDQYAKHRWSSANAAAHALKDAVLVSTVNNLDGICPVADQAA